ncbi:MAG: zinc-dependent metalloprotease, partial [Bacteroidia bacterium]|nr:zinc-dependent metalloprotease [Bacteroidia bacterium]
FRRYLGHVIANVGGVIEISKSQDQEENTYTHQSKTNQKRAMAFLNQHLFTSPVWMIDDELTRKFEEDGAIDRIKSLQSGVLRQLFNTGRLNRMIENEALNGKEAYSVYELFNDTENYLFGSVMENNDVYQRNLQRYYIERMKNLVEEDGNNVVISDIKAAALGSLKSIQKRVKKAKNMDDINGYHQMDIKMRVDKILE